MDFRRLSDVELILLILAAIYLWECACWLRGNAVCFAPMLRRYRQVRSARFLENDRGRLVLTNPLPFALPVVCQAWPVAVSPDGICGTADAAGGNGAEGPPVPLPLDAIHRIEQDEHHVRVNGKAVATMTSPQHAALLAETLQRLIKVPRTERKKAIERALKRTADLESVAARLAELKRATLSLRVLCTAFFLYTFAVGPLVYYFFPGRDPLLTLLVYLVGFGLLWLTTIFEYVRARRVLYAEPLRKRLGPAAMMLLSPASAMRSADLAGRGALSGYHPLAVALVVCGPEAKREYARRTLLGLRYPAADVIGAADVTGDCDRAIRESIEGWFRARLIDELDCAVRLAGMDPVELLAPPERQPDALSYCPRCNNQFVTADGNCSDCGGLRLVSFDG